MDLAAALLLGDGRSEYGALADLGCHTKGCSKPFVGNFYRFMMFTSDLRHVTTCLQRVLDSNMWCAPPRNRCHKGFRGVGSVQENMWVPGPQNLVFASKITGGGDLKSIKILV